MLNQSEAVHPGRVGVGGCPPWTPDGGPVAGRPVSV